MRFLFEILWASWAVSWFGAAWWSNRTQKRVGLRRELPYRLVLALGALSILGVPRGYEGELRLWHVGYVGAWICLATLAVGFSFTWWARLHLGRLWSGAITKKEGHRVVDTGPYGIVRHPIYTGILLAILGTAAAKGTVFALIGAALVTLGLWMKARLEEEWLRGELGSDAYDAYKRRVPMLLPFGPRG